MTSVQDHRAAAQRLKALAASVPGSADTLKPYIDYHEATAAALEAQEDAVRPSKALSGDGVGNYPFGYSRGRTGAVERRTVHIATPPARPSSAFWPDITPVEHEQPSVTPLDDIRIDPPYDR